MRRADIASQDAQDHQRALSLRLFIFAGAAGKPATGRNLIFFILVISHRMCRYLLPLSFLCIFTPFKARAFVCSGILQLVLCFFIRQHPENVYLDIQRACVW